MRWSLLPLLDTGLGRVRVSRPALRELATRTWEIAPPERIVPPPAFFLPGQLERVISAFEYEPLERQIITLRGGTPGTHSATRGFLLRDVVLLDGVLYKRLASEHIAPRQHRMPPRLRIEKEIERGAMYSSAQATRWFGQWLMDDIATYPLAEAEGTVVATDYPVGRHIPQYESWLGMKPRREGAVYFRELVLFDDRGQNAHKRARYQMLRDRAYSHLSEPIHPHPGVFVLRGLTGERRVMVNEMELAEQLSRERGFRILDPSKVDVPEIVRTMAGARAVVGIESSGIMHGLFLLQPGGAVLTLQPPRRFYNVMKDVVDRDQQHYGFVVGAPHGDDFYVEPDHVLRTLDLFPQPPPTERRSEPSMGPRAAV